MMDKTFIMKYKNNRKEGTCTEDSKLLKNNSAEIANKAKAGQFIITSAWTKKGERIPLTITDLGHKKGTNTIIFLEVGVVHTQTATLEVRPTTY
jgi:NAD(P)H-flavin reductase